jgi:hypothetical protein
VGYTITDELITNAGVNLWALDFAVDISHCFSGLCSEEGFCDFEPTHTKGSHFLGYDLNKYSDLRVVAIRIVLSQRIKRVGLVVPR